MEHRPARSQSTSASPSAASSTSWKVSLPAQSSYAAGARDEVQIMVAEHGVRPVPQVGDEPKHLQRGRTAIDEITREPEPVASGIEAELSKQRPQLG